MVSGVRLRPALMQDSGYLLINMGDPNDALYYRFLQLVPGQGCQRTKVRNPDLPSAETLKPETYEIINVCDNIDNKLSIRFR
jgi:hypothetical protein